MEISTPVLLLLFFTFISESQSFKQELWLYDGHDNSYYFDLHEADLSEYKRFLPKVTRACARGRWDAFTKFNFRGNRTALGSLSSSNLTCDSVNASNFKSLRHLGAHDTILDDISLYEGSDYDKKEILVTTRARTAIPHQILSFAATGTSSWMLFQGKDLDGKSFCYPRTSSQYYFRLNQVQDLGLTTIGSVFEGCDLQEIESYKIKHSL